MEFFTNIWNWIKSHSGFILAVVLGIALIIILWPILKVFAWLGILALLIFVAGYFLNKLAIEKGWNWIKFD